LLLFFPQIPHQETNNNNSNNNNYARAKTRKGKDGIAPASASPHAPDASRT
jgi:hypothetical protein